MTRPAGAISHAATTDVPPWPGVRVGSLCSGYEGLPAETFGGTLAWVADIDADAATVLSCRFPGVANLGDITKVDWRAVERVDVLLAGFPCQDVSAAGRLAGLRHGNRSGLWHVIVSAITVLRPRLIVIENVLGLLSARGDEPTDDHLAAEARRDTLRRLLEWTTNASRIAMRKGDEKRVRDCAARAHRVMGAYKRAVDRCRWHEQRLVRAIGTVLGSLASLGFDAEWTVLSAADAGSCHLRKRVFIAAWPAEDPDVAAGVQRWIAASGEAEGGRSRADAGG